MNILFIANYIQIYGANRSMLDLAIALRGKVDSVFFFFPEEGKAEGRYAIRQILNENGFHYAFISYAPSVHAGGESRFLERILHRKINKECMARMQRYVKKWSIDIIHTNSLTHNIGAELAQKSHCSHVWHIREALKEDYNLIYDDKRRTKRLLGKADCVVCISEYVRAVHGEMLKHAKVQTLYNGLKLENYVLDGAFVKNPKVYHIIICGVVREEKGQLDAVMAAAKLIQQYHMENIHLQIVGDGFGDYYKKICCYIKENKLEEYVELIPFQSDLRTLRREADIALVCSKNEALGRVTIESMMSENVVIGTDIAGTAEIIEDGVNGYLYHPDDIEDLCDKLRFVINNWELQEEMVSCAKEYVWKNYDSNRYAEKIFQIYEELSGLSK